MGTLFILSLIIFLIMFIIGSFDNNHINTKDKLIYKNNHRDIADIIKAIRNNEKISNNDLLAELFLLSDISKNFILENFSNSITKFITQEKKGIASLKLNSLENDNTQNNKCINIHFGKRIVTNKLLKKERKESLKGFNRLHWKFIYTVEQSISTEIKFKMQDGSIISTNMITDKSISTITNVLSSRYDNFDYYKLEYKGKIQNYDNLITEKEKLIFLYNLKYDKELLNKFNSINTLITSICELDGKTNNKTILDTEFNQKIVQFEILFEDSRNFFKTKLNNIKNLNNRVS